MALITCPECQKDISDQAKKCPNCGYPITPIIAIQEEKTSFPQIEIKKDVDWSTLNGWAIAGQIIIVIGLIMGLAKIVFSSGIAVIVFLICWYLGPVLVAKGYYKKIEKKPSLIINYLLPIIICLVALIIFGAWSGEFSKSPPK